MKIIPAFCSLNKVILVQAVPFHSHYKPPTSLFLTLSFISLIRPLKFVWMESPWIYEYLFETKFIQGCRPVSFHCLLRLLALLSCTLLQTRCWQHWRHATVTRQIWEALGKVVDILAGKTRPMLSEHWSVFCSCTVRQSGWIRQVIKISAAKHINSHERTFLVNFFKKYYFHIWNSEYGRLTKMVYPWMEGVSLKWIVHFFCSWQMKGQSLSCKQLLPEMNFIKADARTWLKNGMLAAKPWA